MSVKKLFDTYDVFLPDVAENYLAYWLVYVAIIANNVRHTCGTAEARHLVVLAAKIESLQGVDLNPDTRNAVVNILNQLQYLPRCRLRPDIAFCNGIVDTAAVDAPKWGVRTDQIVYFLCKIGHTARDKGEITALGFKIFYRIKILARDRSVTA